MRLRYVVGVLGVILVIFLLVALIFGRGGNTTTQNNKTAPQLVDYADKNSSVSLTTVGRLVGNDERREIRVTVTPNERRLEILSGYDESVISLQTYPNTREAYSNFLSALATNGFTKKRSTSITDPRGLCPTGNRYIYDLSEDGNHLSNLWNTSCNDGSNFAGRGSTVREIFKNQIPDYNKQTQSVHL
jgi:hypothetical protein